MIRSIAHYVKNQKLRHPHMEVQDVIKMIYQASFVSEHRLGDEMEKGLIDESLVTPVEDGPLFEEISDDVLRVNISSWLFRGLPLSWLCRVISYKYRPIGAPKELFLSYIREVYGASERGELFFGKEEFEREVREYMEGGIRAIHHSEGYDEYENPHYRIVSSYAKSALLILSEIKRRGANIIRIDGRSHSGKTTTGNILSYVFDTSCIHMDDFFLPESMRSEERLNESGGNIDYERFKRQIIPYLEPNTTLRWQRYNCQSEDYEDRSILLKDKIIVEGSYSMHPYFGSYADLSVFMDIGHDEQLKRVKERNDRALNEKFLNIWIPMEERYFDSFSIRDRADLVL